MWPGVQMGHSTAKAGCRHGASQLDVARQPGARVGVGRPGYGLEEAHPAHLALKVVHGAQQHWRGVPAALQVGHQQALQGTGDSGKPSTEQAPNAGKDLDTQDQNLGQLQLLSEHKLATRGCTCSTLKGGASEP